jgi:hypothetical protein
MDTASDCPPTITLPVPETNTVNRCAISSTHTQRPGPTPLASSVEQLPIPAKALTILVPLNHSTTPTACQDRDRVQPN